MVDLKILESRGISAEKLKALFTADNLAEGPQRLINLVRSRIEGGRQFNFTNYKLYYAIDQAFDAAFKQTTATLATNLANALVNAKDNAAAEQIYKTTLEWGLTHLLTDDYDPKTGKVLSRKKFSLPIFFNIIIPLAPAYTLIRAAKLIQDRNQDPYLKYEPFRNTALDRLRCEIITDWIRVMSKNYGYPHIGSQAILKMLIYGDQFMFPQEEWHEEKQLAYVKAEPRPKIVREGIRYYFPHPSRTYADRSYAFSTFNTDTGCEYAGNWRVQRAGEVRRNKNLWNLDRMQFPGEDLRTAFPAFFNTIYKSCAIAFPQTAARWSELNREEKELDNFYSQTFDDFAVVLSDHFQRLIPAEYGLGDYDYPVWFRFLMANDITPLWIAPLPSVAPIYLGYSPEDARLFSTSLTLEILPFQDHVSNLMTQTILTAKQNLANLTFVNEDVVDEGIIKQLENLGEAQYRRLNLFRYSDYKFKLGQNTAKFETINFPQRDTNQIVNVINALLGVLERVLVMSAQEVAGQASHEQSAEEVRNVQRSVSNRLAYTSFQVNKSFDAWKTQLYNYSMAYADEEVWAQIPSDQPLTKEALENLGFTVEDTGLGEGSEARMVRGKKTALALQSFASTREGEDRINNAGVAAAMVQAFGMALQSEMLSQSIGPQQAIKLFNQILSMFGLPRDFRILFTQPSPSPEQAQQEFQRQLLIVVEKVKEFVLQNDQAIVQKFTEALKPIAEIAEKALQLGQHNQESYADLLQVLHGAPTAQVPIIHEPITTSPAYPGGTPAPQELVPVV